MKAWQVVKQVQETMKEIEELVPLYSIDIKGKIRECTFFMNVLGDDESYRIGVRNGLQDGKKVETSTLITGGKNIGKSNQTTTFEQAVSELKSMWEAKRLEGYKSRKDLLERTRLKSTYFPEDLSEASVNYLFKVNEITYNSNPDWYPLPMLAKPAKIKDIPEKEFPIFGQPKLNGVRCLAIVEEGKVVLMSRGGIYYDIPHIKEAIETRCYKAGKLNIILDGEIYCHGKPLQKISGAVRKEKQEYDLFGEDKTWLEYHIYDVVNGDQQWHRKQLVELLLPSKEATSGVLKYVSTHALDTKEDIKRAHNFYVSQGYEGLILRPRNCYYTVSFRSKSLLKIKEFLDEEFEIIGCEVDHAKSIGDSFVFKLRNNKNKLEFKARPIGSREQKQAYYMSISKLVGKKATVRFQERSESGLPLQGHVQAIRNYE